MHADSSGGVPIIYMTTSEGCAPDFHDKFEALCARLQAAQKNNKIQRDWLGQSCSVAPIIRMDKVIDSVFKNMSRRIVHEVLKDNYGEDFADEFVNHIHVQEGPNHMLKIR